MGMIIIKNYSMPHNCYDCDIHNYHECDLTSESIEEDYCWNGDSREKHCPLREVEATPKADYEARLRADVMAMLEQLDSEIQEQIAFMGDGEETNGMKRADNLVKDKINALKQSIWQDNYNGKKEWLDGTYEKTSN